MSGLTTVERSSLAVNEAIIERGQQTFVEVGAAFMAIRDGRQYREEYSTFEEYLQKRWGMERAHGYRLIEAAQIVKRVSPNGDIPAPATESQARELSAVAPEAQAEVWAEAVETAPDGKVTAAHVREVVESHKPHVANNSGDHEWYTPAEYIEAARKVLGAIDLDPASHADAQKVVKAKRFYSSEDDGLTKPWEGCVWMNPPYSSGLVERFAEKLVKAYRADEVKEAIVLVNNATETRWFQGIAAAACGICLPLGRVKFWHPRKESVPLQGQAIIYLGEDFEEFRKAFLGFGVTARFE